MKPIVVVDTVSKKYSRNANSHLSYGLSNLWHEICGNGRKLTLRKDEFLAVDHVSFHLNPGESLALIGRNGSGKTTLLKMMNGLVKLDGGTIVVNGRVQALINLGAGFNSNLSGRDNVVNLAALMGLSRREIGRIFKEIADFAEIDDFIDSPVQTYSSGMKSRLAFAVAVHLEPDILLIDEILSVGDHAFRNKCFIKMHELKKAGMSIVLVSHSHTQVVQICERALWLDKGQPKQIGPAKETVQAYLTFLDEVEKERALKLNALKEETARGIAAESTGRSRESLYGPIYDEFDKIDDLRCAFIVDEQEVESFRVHDEITIEYSFRLKEPVTDLNVSLAIFSKEGLKLNTISTLNGDLLIDIHTGAVSCRVRIHDFNLNPGHYVLVMPVHEGKSYLYRDVVKEFVVTGNGRLTWEFVDFKYEYEVLGPDGSKSS